ncbi:MAG: HAD hydrolase-like protein, partial [Oscillospiraceae bacterium]|nr:HAD hydrolase-like protein [Oscillospiraceae bacterium]
MNSYQWLLFDADNTLFDFDTAEDHALTRTLLHFQIPAEPPVKKCYHAINDGLWKDFENGKISREALAVRRFVLLMDALKVQGEAEEWNRYYMNALSQCAALIPGAEALCRRAAQKYTLALITNGAPDIQRKRLNNSPIAQYFGDRVFI